jgi:hypothetical protein
VAEATTALYGEIVHGRQLVRLPGGTIINVFPGRATVTIETADGDECWSGVGEEAQVLALALWAASHEVGADEGSDVLAVAHDWALYNDCDGDALARSLAAVAEELIGEQLRWRPERSGTPASTTKEV